MLMNRNVLVAFAAAFLLLTGAATASAGGLNSMETSLLRAVNQTRAAHGLAAVRVDGTLERAARAHSAEMIAQSYFGHGAFADRMNAFGARGRFLGENLAWGTGSYGSPSSVIRAWLASPEHRANLLRPGYRRIGIGAVVGSFQGQSGAVVITADFAGR
jgi:uncharacterized protein YkwD